MTVEFHEFDKDDREVKRIGKIEDGEIVEGEAALEFLKNKGIDLSDEQALLKLFDGPYLYTQKDGSWVTGRISKSDLHKGRVYVDSPDEAPEGVEVQQGERGGLWYDPAQAEAAGQAETDDERPDEGGDAESEPEYPMNPEEDLQRFHEDPEMDEEIERVREGAFTGFTLNRDLTDWDGEAYIVTLTNVNPGRDGLDKASIEEFYQEYQPVLEESDGVKMGTWADDPDSNYLSIDLNVALEDEEEAVELGKKFNQKAIWNAYDNEPIDTGGSGEAVIESPEEIKEALSNIDSFTKALLLAREDVPMNYMDEAREESQRYADPDGNIHSEWEIFLGLRSGRFDSAEKRDDGTYVVVRDGQETVLNPVAEDGDNAE